MLKTLLQTLGIMALTLVGLFALLLCTMLPGLGTFLLGLAALVFVIWFLVSLRLDIREEERRKQELVEQWEAMSTAEKAEQLFEGLSHLGKGVMNICAGTVALGMVIVALPLCIAHGVGSMMTLPKED